MYDEPGNFGTSTAPPAQPKVKKPNQALVVWGWITTWLFTPIGIVLSIILLAKGTRNGHAGWMLGIGLAWIAFIVITVGMAFDEMSASLDTYAQCLEAANTEVELAVCDELA